MNTEKTRICEENASLTGNYLIMEVIKHYNDNGKPELKLDKENCKR